MVTFRELKCLSKGLKGNYLLSLEGHEVHKNGLKSFVDQTKPNQTGYSRDETNVINCQSSIIYL